MNMIGNTANPKTLALVIPNNGGKIGVKIGTNSGIQPRHSVFGAKHDMHEKKTQRSRHGCNYMHRTWGVTPRWYSVAPPALLSCALIMCLTMILGCNSTPAPKPITTTPTPTIARPTTPPPPFKLFHATADSFTLVTLPTATDDQISAILWQLRDAAHTHTFDHLGIPQKVVDARDPMVWFHLYRGPKCASEKYTDGKLPCGASYHAAGDYTFGGGPHHDWDSGVLLPKTDSPTDHETQLWPPGSPYSAPH